jgi:hypothetical protein
MSSGYQQHFTAANIDMLHRVLDRAGIADLPGALASALRSKASRFLIETFQHGMTSESALYFALVNRTGELGAAVVTPTNVTPPIADATRRPIADAKDGYRFGRRVEQNGTWTIYHVFSGEPANYGAWNMAGLTVRTADRALRILNAPLKAA